MMLASITWALCERPWRNAEACEIAESKILQGITIDDTCPRICLTNELTTCGSCLATNLDDITRFGGWSNACDVKISAVLEQMTARHTRLS